MATKRKPEFSKVPVHGDKVFVGERKGPFRVVGFKEVNGERLVLASGGDCEGDAFRLRLKHGCVPKMTVPIADVVRDIGRRGWRQRWQQGSLLVNNTESQPDVS